MNKYTKILIVIIITILLISTTSAKIMKTVQDSTGVRIIDSDTNPEFFTSDELKTEIIPKNFQLKSDDNNIWCVSIRNDGSLKTTLGVCIN